MRRLAEELARQGMPQPESRLLWSTAPETVLACFHVGVYSDKELIGKSKT